jgi:hypothetical protein
MKRVVELSIVVFFLVDGVGLSCSLVAQAYGGLAGSSGYARPEVEVRLGIGWCTLVGPCITPVTQLRPVVLVC